MRWLHEDDVERKKEETDELGGDDEETVEETILREDKFGVLSLFSQAKEEETGAEIQPRLLSPYQMGDACEWEAVHERFCGRRRTACAAMDGPAETFPIGALFFPQSVF